MNNIKSFSTLILILFFSLRVYPQQDTTSADTTAAEIQTQDSVIVNINLQSDSSFTKIPLEQNISDSISVDAPQRQDSSLPDTLINEAIEDSVEKDTALDQNSSIIKTPADSVQIDSIFTEDVHPQDISDQAGFILENLGKWGSLRIYGSMRLNGAFDLNGLLNTNGFSTYDIPVGEDAIDQGRFFMAPYQTRLGIEVKRSGLLNNFRIKIETDFLGANNGLRLRHAFIETGNFIIGQTWSTFTDVNSVPQTVDIDGPNSSVQLRTVRIRYADRLLQSKLRYLVSLEAPSPDIVLPDSLSDRVPAQFIPDIAGQLVRNFDFGYLSLSTIIRGITVKDSSGSSEQILGYGFLLAGVYALDPDNKFLFQGVYGAAISRFITALNGKGIDLVYNPNTELFEATKSFGLMLSYTHNWRADISSAFTLGMVGINNKDYEPADAFSQSWYYSANVFWNALLGVRLGLEFSQGRRINNDGNWGRATRIGFIFYADF
ncbi:MAG: DcaP family trimeric outer membrane transporter [Ignavibacterium sp.]|nr:DcaP family trimeric outer membrane transporter [Ignavibacterium sp.]